MRSDREAGGKHSAEAREQSSVSVHDYALELSYAVDGKGIRRGGFRVSPGGPTTLLAAASAMFVISAQLSEVMSWAPMDATPVSVGRGSARARRHRGRPEQTAMAMGL